MLLMLIKIVKASGKKAFCIPKNQPIITTKTKVAGAAQILIKK